jgi:hypothetical protein
LTCRDAAAAGTGNASAPPRAQLQQLRVEHEARMREQGEKDEAERLLDQVSKGVRAVADAKQRAENKRALSARARELDAARKQAERCCSTAASATNTCAGTIARFSSLFCCLLAGSRRSATKKLRLRAQSDRKSVV